ncbi:MAG: bifunctional 23S rRNA (guanine(2069)-N(7))-methyltransferase RlmK/23S rRNA (guanine(2445)-N(2))-methyltransferase RlmL [Thermoanaerobaculia bacterium]
MRFFATASKGTEQVLADELRDFGLGGIEVGRGGVSFGKSLEEGYRACLWSRVASRILQPMARFEVDGADALYQGAAAIRWTDHLGPETTLAVDVAGGGSPAGPSHFLALKTKDAIVDRIRQAEGTRPDVDTKRPDVRVNVHVAGPKVTVSIDLAGRGLHRRGIGRSGAEAPLKENLAAALLAIAGWPGDGGEAPLYDPFCGSATILLEAAWMALDVAPGLIRGRFGAERWRGHDRALWKRLLAEARERLDAGRERQIRLAGTDASPAAIRAAGKNLDRAGLTDRVRLRQRELRDVEAPWDDAGLVVTNPPYGERLGEAGELGPLYELLGDVLKRRFPGWSSWVLCGNPALAKRIGLRPSSRHVLYNGPIECRLLEIPISSATVTGDRGPGWRKPSDETRGLANKLRKNLRKIVPRARREGLTAYRLYDADMPKFNFAVDWYDGAVRVEEYARPFKVDAADAERRLREALLVIPEVLEIEPADVILRVRQRQAAGEQHHKRGDRGGWREVREGDLRFLVNLEDFLDTGLFLDDRLLRRRIRDRSAGGDFLNLFSYTCSASVAAAVGGARSTTSVDLSKPYLHWGRQNFAKNELEEQGHRFLRLDVVQWLKQGREWRRFDQVLVAPPTYSRSKGMEGDFDVARDHVWLLSHCARLLKAGGEILFTTNLRTFELDEERLGGLVAEEITKEITPFDFARRPRLRAWVLRRPSP